MLDNEQTTSADETSTESTESATALGGQEATTASDSQWWSDLTEENRDAGLVKQFADQPLESFVKSAIATKSMVGADTIKMFGSVSSDI